MTSLAVYDETPEKLVNHNFIRVYRGYEFQARHPEISGILPDKIYIQPVDTADGSTYFKEMADHLSLLYSRDEVKAISENGVEALEVSGVYDKFMTMPLGIFTNTVKRAGSHGFYVVLRPANVAHAPKAFIDDFSTRSMLRIKSAVSFSREKKFSATRNIRRKSLRGSTSGASRSL